MYFNLPENKKLLGVFPKYQSTFTQILEHYDFNMNSIWRITDLGTTLTVKYHQPPLTTKLTISLCHGLRTQLVCYKPVGSQPIAETPWSFRAWVILNIGAICWTYCIMLNTFKWSWWYVLCFHYFHKHLCDANSDLLRVWITFWLQTIGGGLLLIPGHLDQK